MAFRKQEPSKRKMGLISLIDVVFLLLLFFLVTSFVAQLAKQEQRLDVPTPENKPGRAQIMIQLLEGGRFFWLDENAAEVVRRIRDERSYLPTNLLNAEILNSLLGTNTFSETGLSAKLEGLVKRADEDPRVKFFILIRCPNEVSYFRVVDIIKSVSKAEYGNIQYGCVGGSIDQIRNCERIRIVRETDPAGKERDNIYIDF